MFSQIFWSGFMHRRHIRWRAQQMTSPVYLYVDKAVMDACSEKLNANMNKRSSTIWKDTEECLPRSSACHRRNTPDGTRLCSHRFHHVNRTGIEAGCFSILLSIDRSCSWRDEVSTIHDEITRWSPVPALSACRFATTIINAFGNL
jgi:hypothetical protein